MTEKENPSQQAENSDNSKSEKKDKDVKNTSEQSQKDTDDQAPPLEKDESTEQEKPAETKKYKVLAFVKDDKGKELETVVAEGRPLGKAFGKGFQIKGGFILTHVLIKDFQIATKWHLGDRGIIAGIIKGNPIILTWKNDGSTAFFNGNTYYSPEKDYLKDAIFIHHNVFESQAANAAKKYNPKFAAYHLFVHDGAIFMTGYGPKSEPIVLGRFLSKGKRFNIVTGVSD